MIDRIAVTVDNQVITESQVIGQIRVTAFLNGEKPDFSGPNRRKTADRLIEQTLVAREMELTRYPQPTIAEIQDTLKQVRSRFPDEASFTRSLAEYGIDLGELQESLRQQAALLRFIDLRFRPEVQVQESDVSRYCENVYLPERRKNGGAASLTLEQAMPLCEEDFTAQLVDTRVEAWLKDSRARARISYREDAFQ
ncbi:MAG TPA: hypothetical protein VHA11_06535 [Bryobacteraceae bacterium]|nr:hypothetical protein [Bryobacteraceae bacterium]